jgi:uncharacterized protein with ATP-grasp and redox domains
MLPQLPIPLPLRGAEIGTFAHRTMTVRIPEIGRRILKENNFPAPVVERLQALLDELPEGAVRGLQDRQAPDWADWQQYIGPYQGMSWLEVPWFFAETYFYRRVLEATGYFQPGPGLGSDPYAYQKRQGLQIFSAQIRSACAAVEPGQAAVGELFADLISMNLWGNQADLSLWPAGQAERPDHADSARRLAHLLCDHSSQVVDHLLGLAGKPCRVDVLLDNAGLELVHDLLLAEALLSSRLAGEVCLHAKAHPTFVSDAVIPDILSTVEFLAQMGTVETGAVARRLREHLLMGRLHLGEHLFWTSPLSMWEMPVVLRQKLGEAALLISKGDANYRRLVGDRHWAFDTPLPGVLSYMPTALLTLRVSKSPVMIGLQPGQAQRMDERDPQWLTNGKWGVIQFYQNHPS